MQVEELWDYLSAIAEESDLDLSNMLNCLLIFEGKRLAMLPDSDKIFGVLKEIPEFAFFKFAGSTFITSEANRGRVEEIIKSRNGETHNITKGRLLDYDYVGKDWNQKAERFNVSFWALGNDNEVELFSYMVPIAHYDQSMKERIRERVKELESTLQKIGYTVVPKLGLSYYSLTTNMPKMRKLPN